MTRAQAIPLTNGAATLGAASRARIPVLHDGDLILRAPELGDFDAYAGIVCSDRADPMGGPLTRDEAWDDFARMTASWVLRGHGVWTVTLGGAVIGFVLIGFEPGDAEPELGYLFTAGAEGRGLATRATRLVLAHAQGPHGVQTLVSYIAPGHLRSVAVAQRLGARREGTLDGSEVWRHLPRATFHERGSHDH